MQGALTINTHDTCCYLNLPECSSKETTSHRSRYYNRRTVGYVCEADGFPYIGHFFMQSAFYAGDNMGPHQTDFLQCLQTELVEKLYTYCYHKLAVCGELGGSRN